MGNTRKNHSRAMESLQASLEAEYRAKAEALRIKKKLESDINELEIALDHANKANAEAHKSIKRYQAQLRDVEGLYEDEGRQRREIAEKAGLADRRANALQGELEEARALLDSADRGKKQADMELADARGAVNDMTTINSKAGSDKRRLESAIHTMHAEIDDMLSQAKNSEEKAKRSLESQIGELDQRLTEANEIASKGGRAAMAKLESRIRELEIELGGSQSKTSDTFKGFQKAERRIKDSNSNWMKTTRTKTACLNWPENSNKRSRPTRSRLRKQKKLLPSTWPSIARPNKSLRRPKSVPNWLETLFPLPVLFPLVCKCEKIKGFCPSVIFKQATKA